ncbi:MAG: ribonuclease P protein component [Mycobacteriales bacterium]
MLSKPHRLRFSTDFREVVRRGRRASRPLLTVHVLRGDAVRPGPAPAGSGEAPTRAGLVVGKAVGGSVVRSRTARRLRHLLRDRVVTLPAGSRVVVRAAPAAGAAPSRALAADLDAALASASRPRSRR